MLHRRTWGFLFACLAVATATASAGAGSQAQIQSMVRAADLRQTKVGLFAIDLQSGEELASFNPDEPMMPASNMKLVTTAAALGILGPDFVFRTELRLLDDKSATQPTTAMASNPTPATTSKPAEGAVLLIRGDGDPGFCDPELLKLHNLDVEDVLQAWVAEARKAGIARVRRLIVDDRVFDNELVHPTWPANQLNAWYCAQVAGINFFDNCLEVYPEPTAPGQSPLVKLRPAAGFISRMETNKAVSNKVDNFWVARRDGTNELTYWGKVKTRRRQAITVTIHDPPMVFGQILAERLAAAGVAVDAVERPAADEQLGPGRTLHVVQTTLPLILQRCNKDSQNLFAEALIKRLGFTVTGAPGSWQNGAAAIRIFLRDRLGTTASVVNIADGSGMSRDNRVTPRVLVELLRAMHLAPQVASAYRASLSVAGQDGTLEKRMAGILKNGFSGQVMGKSGYIEGVCSLSGYIVLGDSAGAATAPAATGPGAPVNVSLGQQRVIAFSFLFNDMRAPVHLHQVQALQDKMVGVLADEYAPAVPRRAASGG